MNQLTFRQALCFLTLVLPMLLDTPPAFAENIDPFNEGLKYAYGENIGWINFKPSQGPGVTVTNSAVTGFAWAENIGWINLSPTNGGVQNNGLGKLSGYAWGENVGWINFAPTGGGVQINPSGYFIGTAWGENIGWIIFNSTGAVPFGVRTSWQGLAEKIPTMTEWGMVILIGLLGMASVNHLRKSEL
jgi:hypothetical protein